MAGKKRNTKKAANSKKIEPKENDQINDCKTDEGEVETTKTPVHNVNKRTSKRSVAASNDAEDPKANDAEEKKHNKKDSDENKDDSKDSTSDSPKATPSNNSLAASKRTSKRNATTNNNVDEASSPKMLRRERREPPKEEGPKTTDNGKTKPSVKEKPQGREYEVEAIMGKRKTKGVEEFLVKWKGYSEKENSWEPKKNLNCQRLLDEFLKNKN